MYFKDANNACPLLTRKWVVSVPHWVWSLLAIPVLGSSECEWLLCLVAFQAYWQYLFLALQEVSGYPHCISSMLMMLVLCCPVCELLQCVTACQSTDGAHLRSLDCECLPTLIYFFPANATFCWLSTDHTHSWPTSLCVDAFLSSLLMGLFLILQLVCVLCIFS